jgi:hypothetical protein
VNIAKNKAFREGNDSTPADAKVVDFSNRSLPSAEKIQGCAHQYVKNKYPKILRNDLQQSFDD